MNEKSPRSIGKTMWAGDDEGHREPPKPDFEGPANPNVEAGYSYAPGTKVKVVGHVHGDRSYQYPPDGPTQVELTAVWQQEMRLHCRMVLRYSFTGGAKPNEDKSDVIINLKEFRVEPVKGK